MTAVFKTEGLTKRFGGLMAINHVDFELQEGEIKALIGPNGAGKTTFYNLITGVYKPDSGKVLFMGEDITRLPPNEICKKGIARTFQVTSIFPKLTVFENVRLAAQVGFGGGVSAFKDISRIKEVTGRVDQILEIVGLMDQRNRISMEISQGDQRLQEVAIALGSNPKVLLLDEPTAGLSAKETEYLVEKVKDLFKNSMIKNIVLVEHDIEVVTGLAHSICVLNYGEVIKDGPVDEVCNDPKVQEVYLVGGKVNVIAG
jgi:branched-chain amino acid transport system ATP-binding protein